MVLKVTLEPETRCRTCNRPILQRTADARDGLCVLCHRKAAAIPPDDFVLPSNLLERIDSLEQCLGFYREIAWQRGFRFAHEMLDVVAKSQERCREWYPRLRELVAEARRLQPCPAEDSLSEKERAKLLIWETKRNTTYPLPRPHKTSLVFCTLPLFAISTAERLCAGFEDRYIHLTDEEWARWDEIYSHPKDESSWYSSYSWRLEDPPDPNGVWLSRGVTPIPAGSEPWLVTTASGCGPFGTFDVELWCWDGAKASFVEQVGMGY